MSECSIAFCNFPCVKITELKHECIILVLNTKWCITKCLNLFFKIFLNAFKNVKFVIVVTNPHLNLRLTGSKSCVKRHSFIWHSFVCLFDGSERSHLSNFWHTSLIFFKSESEVFSLLSIINVILEKLYKTL